MRKNLFDELDNRTRLPASSTDTYWDDLAGGGSRGSSRSSGNTAWSHSSYAPRCYHSHPPLPLPGTDLVIYGGSCLSPAVADADVYIGFDSGMRMTSRNLPWTPGWEIAYPITDMSVPKDPNEFAQLVNWTRERLAEGLKVHCGCIGGHGRTGLFFSALVRTYGEVDATTYVREHYCKKAVESTSQVDFLEKYFGVLRVQGAKSYGSSSSGRSSGSRQKEEKLPRVRKSKSPTGTPCDSEDVFAPLAGRGRIW